MQEGTGESPHCRNARLQRERGRTRDDCRSSQASVSCVRRRRLHPGKGAASGFACRVSAAARFRPSQQRANARTDAPRRLLCPEAGVFPALLVVVCCESCKESLGTSASVRRRERRRVRWVKVRVVIGGSREGPASAGPFVVGDVSGRDDLHAAGRSAACRCPVGRAVPGLGTSERPVGAAVARMTKRSALPPTPLLAWTIQAPSGE